MTRTRGLVAALLVAAGAAPAPAQIKDEAVAALDAKVAIFSARFPALAMLPLKEPDETSFVYGDSHGVVHHVVYQRERLHDKWQSVALDGPVKGVFGADLDGDGSSEIIAYTTTARIYVWDSEKHELRWESVEERFEGIQAMAIADVDRDAPKELVVCASHKIAYYDGAEFFREREGRDFVDPTAMLVADVDGDLTPEIVTNDGYVIDSASLNIEWAVDGFGSSIALFDLDGDGSPELAGEAGGSLAFWDLKDRREIR
jgi:hypothetical protein